MRIYLVRHGESRWQVNPDDNWDTDLTNTGHEQSKQLAGWLASSPHPGYDSRVKIAGLYTSSLKRAQQTGRYLASAMGLPLTVNKYFDEAWFHVASMLPYLEDPFVTKKDFVLPEDYLVFKQQVAGAFAFLVTEASVHHAPLLVVTHGGFIKTFLRYVIGTDAVCFRLYNCSVSLIEWRRNRWHLVFLNCWHHLPPELITE